MNSPELSFIITVYNKAKFLPQVLQAVQEQQLDVPCEFIIINDGSTDGSDKIIENIASSWVGCNIINQENRGVVATTLTGIEQAHGEFIKFVDGDDLLLPHLTHHQLALLKRNHELDYVACSFGWVDNGTCRPKYADYEQVSSRPLEASDVAMVHGRTALWNILTRNGGFAEALTGMSGGLSRKSSIDVAKATSLANQYDLRQMQDHLISATSLLHDDCAYAFIKKIGFVELSKSTSADRSNTLSAASSRGRREQALINHALLDYLSMEQRLSLMHGDLRMIFRALHGKASLRDKILPLSSYNRTRSISKRGNTMQIETHYNRLMEELFKPTTTP